MQFLPRVCSPPPAFSSVARKAESSILSAGCAPECGNTHKLIQHRQFFGGKESLLLLQGGPEHLILKLFHIWRLELTKIDVVAFS